MSGPRILYGRVGGRCGRHRPPAGCGYLYRRGSPKGLEDRIYYRDPRPCRLRLRTSGTGETNRRADLYRRRIRSRVPPRGSRGRRRDSVRTVLAEVPANSRTHPRKHLHPDERSRRTRTACFRLHRRHSLRRRRGKAGPFADPHAAGTRRNHVPEPSGKAPDASGRY